jgi:hypothetical protein
MMSRAFVATHRQDIVSLQQIGTLIPEPINLNQKNKGKYKERSKMKQIRQVILFAVCMLAVGLWAQQSQPAQTGEHHHHMGMGQGKGMGHGHGMMNVDEHLQMLAQKLNLTDDQKTKIRPILEEHLKDRDAIMKDQSLSPDQKHAKMKESMDAAHAKIDPILSDQQKKQLAQMMQDMHDKGHGMGMHDHHGPHHGPDKDNSSPK